MSPDLEIRHHVRTSNDDDIEREARPIATVGRANRARKRQGGADARDEAVEAAPKGAASSSKGRRAQLTPRSGCRSNRSYPTLWLLPVITGRNVEAAHPTKRGVTAANISETTGGWATATVTTPSRSSRLARQPLSPYHERTEERSDRPHDR